MQEYKNAPHILLVNPWIHDFAAYDVWSKPMGLLILAAILRDHGFRVSYIDCLDRFHPGLPSTDPYARNGRGPYYKTELPLPEGLEDIGRRFSRYGIPPELFRNDLKEKGKPDLILVTSIMTYWATGVKETISEIRNTWPGVPIWLGGIYATLCEEHAQRESGADRVITGPSEASILDKVSSETGFLVSPGYDAGSLDALPYPAYDLQNVINYVPVRTSSGCPFHCSYCASGVLAPKWKRRSPDKVTEEILYWNEKYGVRDFAFYDDALLVDSDNHAEIIFNGIIESGRSLFFHTPNALHVREINKKTASLMYRSGFKTLRLGVESTDFSDRNDMDCKVSESDFNRAVSALRDAGFRKEQIGAYLLIGLPGQSFEEVEVSVREALKSGITPVLTHYTPIPKTDMWNTAVASSRYDLEENPLFTNNSIFPCRQDRFSWDEITRLKKIIAGKDN